MLFGLFGKRGARESEARAAPSVGADRRVYAIGDIHGRHDLLCKLLDKIAADRAAHPAAQYELIFLGDYVDRGNESRDVLDLLSQGPIEGFATTYLRGNHEDYILRFLKDTKGASSWLYYGGANTLISYGIPVSPLEDDPDRLIAIQQKLRNNLPEAHVAFLRNLETSHAVGDYFFVHAGVRPGVPLDKQSTYDLLWIREPFLESTKYHGRMIVHGHSVQMRPEILPNRIGIDTGAYDTGVLTALVLQGEERSLLQT
jgi:serine/threonine protein phosphatase 1